MLEVIIDTNVIIRAILKQQENEDCWKVLHLLRKGDIAPVTSKQLEKEYIAVTAKVTLLALSEKFSKCGYDEKVFESMYQGCI